MPLYRTGPVRAATGSYRPRTGLVPARSVGAGVYHTRYDFSARSRASPAHRHLVPRLRASRRPLRASGAAQAQRVRHAVAEAVRPVQRAGLPADVPGGQCSGLRAPVPAHLRDGQGRGVHPGPARCARNLRDPGPAGERDGAGPGAAVHRDQHRHGQPVRPGGTPLGDRA